MKTSLFISQCVQRIENGETLAKKYNSSVMVDGNTIYSYGYHYPLLFRIEDKNGRTVWVCNSAGYSNTTAKHISYSAPHAQVFAKIGSTSGFFSQAVDKIKVLQSLHEELSELDEQMQKKTRNDTKVYRALERQAQTVQGYIGTLL